VSTTKGATRGMTLIELTLAMAMLVTLSMVLFGFLRTRMGLGVRLVVAALCLPGAGEEADVEQWRRRLTAIGDPWLRTVALPVESGEAW